VAVHKHTENGKSYITANRQRQSRWTKNNVTGRKFTKKSIKTAAASSLREENGNVDKKQPSQTGPPQTTASSFVRQGIWGIKNVPQIKEVGERLRRKEGSREMLVKSSPNWEPEKAHKAESQALLTFRKELRFYNHGRLLRHEKLSARKGKSEGEKKSRK